MADERGGTREFDTRKTLSWMELLRTFLIALDPFKLLVAAAGILATAVGWWILSALYYGAWSEKDANNRESEINDRRTAYVKDGKNEDEAKNRAESEYNAEYDRFKLMHDLAGPGGSYRKMPWFEERGRNPFLVARGAVSGGYSGGKEAINWFVSQVGVLVEPLIKFLSPVLGLFDSRCNFWVRLYLFFLIIWMLMMWAFFGGIITRMAIVQIAGKEGGGLRDSIKFVKTRYLSYLCSPVVPIGLIFAVVLGCVLFGLFHLIPGIGDFIDGLLWWIPLGAGFVMALLVVGLVGYPLMYTTLSAEGSDTFDALSRSYNYVYESPWHYIWYGFVSVVYGAVVVFFVVFMSSLMVYLGKWGVSQTPLTQSVNRSPEFLFIYSPTSFGWRELMLKGSPVEITPDEAKAGVDKDGNKVLQTDGYYYVHPDAAKFYMKDPDKGFYYSTYFGAGMVAFWMTLLFMMMLGFSYSFFWTQASMIYLLMRKKVDEVEVDEIYTEEEDFDEPVAPPKLSTPPAPTAPTSIPVDAPSLRVQPSPPPPATPPDLPPIPLADSSSPPPEPKPPEEPKP
jgi:hypothetical protein